MILRYLSRAVASRAVRGNRADGTSHWMEALESRVLLSGVGNHAPTLTKIAPLGVAIADNPFSIDFGQLLGASNAADADGDALAFQITFLGANTVSLTLDGDPVTTFPILVSAGQTLVWTAKPGSKGKVAAFSVEAFDGVAASAKPAVVDVATVLQPTITITANRPKASEQNATTTGMGQYTIKRGGGDTTQSLDVNFSIDTSAAASATNGDDYTLQSGATVFNGTSGTFTFAPGQTSMVVNLTPAADMLREGPETATLVIPPAAGTTYLAAAPKNRATIAITDCEVSPDSIAGDIIDATISTGMAPLAAKGAFELVLSVTGNRYLLTGGTGVGSSFGTYAYARTASATASITLTDSVGGTRQGTISFTTPTAATFSLNQTGGSGTQTGKMTFITSRGVSFTPASLAGRSASAKITAGSGSLASKGAFAMAFSQAGSDFVMAGSSGSTGRQGTYAYEMFAPNVGLIKYLDVAGHSSMMVVRFSSATSASYLMTNDTGGSETGTLLLNPIPAEIAPGALSGSSINAVVSSGAAPYASKGIFLLNLSTSTYTLTGAFGVGSSSGDYAYEQFTPNIAVLTLNDSVIGPEFGFLTFTSATQATYTLIDSAAFPATAAQQGVMTFQNVPAAAARVGGGQSSGSTSITVGGGSVLTFNTGSGGSGANLVNGIFGSGDGDLSLPPASGSTTITNNTGTSNSNSVIVAGGWDGGAIVRLGPAPGGGGTLSLGGNIQAGIASNFVWYDPTGGSTVTFTIPNGGGRLTIYHVADAYMPVGDINDPQVQMQFLTHLMGTLPSGLANDYAGVMATPSPPSIPAS